MFGSGGPIRTQRQKRLSCHCRTYGFVVRARAGAIFGIFAVLAFTGCIGSDDVGPSGDDLADAAQATVTEADGSVTGQVITINLDQVPGVEIGLVNRTGSVELTKTDRAGRYTFNDVRPGPYRIQINAPCCRAYTESIMVKAGEVAESNIQLEPLSELDLATPFIEPNEWQGFVSCGVSLFNAPAPVCSATTDPNHDIEHEFTIEPGLQEIVVAMVWNENSAAPDYYGNALRLDLRSIDCEGCNYRYIADSTSSPIIEWVNDETIADDFARWVHLNQTRTMRFNVDSGHTNLFFQQGFTIYWHEFYHKRAPLDFEPIPQQ